MSSFPTRILLATDGSEGARLAADTAATLVASTGSELHVVCVGPGLPLYELPDYPARFEETAAAQKREAKRVLDTEVKRLEDAGAAVAEARLETDERPDRAIVRLAEELGAGLLVVGSRGLGGLRGALMGSVSDSVVHHAHCPVMVCATSRSPSPRGSSWPPTGRRTPAWPPTSRSTSRLSSTRSCTLPTSSRCPRGTSDWRASRPIFRPRWSRASRKRPKPSSRSKWGRWERGTAKSRGPTPGWGRPRPRSWPWRRS